MSCVLPACPSLGPLLLPNAPNVSLLQRLPVVALLNAGMPSAHSAFVVGLTTAVGIKEGTGSSLFAVALVLTLIVQ